MNYEARNRFEERIGNFENYTTTEMSLKAGSLDEIKRWITETVACCTGSAKGNRIRYSVYKRDDDNVLVERMFYTYEKGEMISYNKDNGRSKEDAE